MSIQTNLQMQPSGRSCEVSQYPRHMNRVSSYIDPTQSPQQYFQQKQQKVTRTSPSHKHRTFAAIIDQNNNKRTYQSKYKLSSVGQRKILMTLAMTQKFIHEYEQKREYNHQNAKKLHNERKKALNFTTHSDFKIIQPVSQEETNLKETHAFFVKLRDGLKAMLRQNFVLEMKKKGSKIQRIMGRRDELDRIDEGDKENAHNEQQQSTKRLIENTFITADFNSTSLSQALPHVDLMAVSSFPENMQEVLQTTKTHNQPSSSSKSPRSPSLPPSPRALQAKFHPLASKLLHTKSRLRIHPARNKYEKRKKEEMRLFLQLNEKTEHLQNFRSDEGKFFKFNQNLKIMVKSVNLCRIVLLNKKNAVTHQLMRLGEEPYWRELNEKTGAIANTGNDQLVIESGVDHHSDDINLKKGNKKDRHKQQKSPKKSLQEPPTPIPNPLAFNPTPLAPSQPLPFTQKPLRIQNYFHQTSLFFTLIQSFLLQFIKRDKGYQNYLKENSLKNKLRLCQKLPHIQQFYHSFVDRCFHMSELVRLYFNALTQLQHQNVSLKEIKVLNRQELQKQNQLVIRLRYVLIYLQKQCENTTQATVQQLAMMRRTEGQGLLSRTLYNSSGNGMSKNVATKSSQLFTPFRESRQSTLEASNTAQMPRTSQLSRPSLVSKPISHLPPPSLSRQPSQSPSQSVLNNPILMNAMSKLMGLPVAPPPSEPLLKQTRLLHSSTASTFKASRKQRMSNNDNSHKEEEKEIDINEVWKTFYNKKFSSNAMRLRMY